MPEVTRVLCAIDLSAASRRVLDCALWWARRHRADVSVLHVHRLVVPPPDTARAHGDPFVTEPGAPMASPPRLDAEERRARQFEIEEFVQLARHEDLQIEVLLDEDPNVAEAIAARADALAADLIVIGAGSDPSSEHPMLGRTTADLLRGAPCSVLVIPAPAPDVSNLCLSGVTRVMCAVSLSDQSRAVLEYAAEVASESTAHLAVVHVVELFSEVAALAYDFDEHREVRIQPACDELVELVAAVIGRDKPVEEIVAQGTACDEILKLAAEEASDLIVLGQGSGRRARGVGRPTGQAVAREARCPVLFVHADPAVASLQPTIPSVSTDRDHPSTATGSAPYPDPRSPGRDR